jgi:hypothetical protein
MTPERAGAYAALFLGLAVLLVAGMFGYAAVSAEAWPLFHDAWRDMGIAQAMLDGTWPEDPVIRDSTSWYNPLAGAVTALTSRLAGMPVPEAAIRIGAFLNLLIPLFFFLAVWFYFGHWPAAAGVVFFVMGNALINRPALWLDTLTYAPWLWAPSLSQAFFFASLLAYGLARRRNRLAWHGVTGLLWGVTFMAHTAPAVLFGLIQLALLPTQYCAPRNTSFVRQGLRVTGRFVFTAAVAFITSLPYSLPVLIRYRFVMKNTRPAAYTMEALTIEKLPDLLMQSLTLSNGIALAGLMWVIWTARRKTGSRILLAWLFWLFALLGANYINQYLESRGAARIPQVVPPHHWMISLGAVKAILFGAGLTGLFRFAHGAVINKITRHQGVRGGGRAAWTCEAGAFLVTASLVLALFPLYREYDRYVPPVDFGWHTPSPQDRIRLRNWMLETCPPESVFLCDEQMSVRLAMPMARKAVLPIDVFTNPYVPFQPRFNAMHAMFTALLQEREAEFRELAEPYGVSHIMVREKTLLEATGYIQSVPVEELEARDLPFLEKIYHNDGIAVYRVLPPGGGRATDKEES